MCLMIFIFIIFYNFAFFYYFGGRRHEALALKSAAPLAGSRAFGMLSAASCQFLSDSKSLCWHRLVPPSHRTGIPLAAPCRHLCRFQADFSPIENSSKNQTPQKPSRNLKSRTPDRPKVDFVLTFGINFGMDFHEILDFFIIC